MSTENHPIEETTTGRFDYHVRPMAPSDYPVLGDLIYYAIFVPSEADPPPKDIVNSPEVIVYIEDFGRENDFGVVAEHDGQILGAAWARQIHADGYVDDETLELAISLFPGYRGQGVGSALLTQLFELLQKQGHLRVSLSVFKNNPALRLYERMGFKFVREGKDDFIMLKILPQKKAIRIA